MSDYLFKAYLRLAQAHQIAAQARSRNKPACDCQTCREMEMLPKVQRIVESFNNNNRSAA